MKLRNIEITGFRGFNKTQSIDLYGDLIIASGENHSGKTSFAEALEWLFFGFTCRCRSGKDKYSKPEYKGTYRNIHYDGDDPPYVELEAVHNDKTVVLRRELIGEEDSEAYLDGSPVKDFTSLGFSSTASHPVIAQHGLRDFIYTNPKSRREILSYILGLETLMDLEQNIKNAHTKYIRRRLIERDSHDTLIREAKELGVLNDVVVLLEEGSLQQSKEALVNEIRNTTGSPNLNETEFLETLSQVRVKSEATVLDLTAFQPIDDLDFTKESLNIETRQLDEKFSNICDRVVAFAKSSTSEDTDIRRIQFLRIGLELLHETEKPETCPFCGERTLTPEQIEGYADLTAKFDDPTQIAELIDKDLDELATAWVDFVEKTNINIPNLPHDEDLARIHQLLAGKSELKNYAQKRTALIDQIKLIETLREEGSRDIEHSRQLLKEPKDDEDLFLKFRDLPTRLEVLGGSLLDHRASYVEQFYKISPILKVKISSSEEVRILNLLQNLWSRWSEVSKALRYYQIENKFKLLQSEAKSFIAEKQKQKLEEKEKEIFEWYEVLNPEEDVSFKRIRVTKTALNLIGQSYGKEIEAPPNFSQSQINCLGLAVYLVKALSTGNLGFVVLDDPVQSMDEAHSERLKIDVLDKLLDTQHQVIVLTHLDKFAENMALTHRHRLPYRIEFSSYSQNGPIIETTPPRLEDYLDQAREYKKGNAERRRQSGRCLRMAVERITKMLYQQATGSLPAKYHRASFPLLKQEVLPKCDQLSPHEADGIRATYNFVVSYPHDDMTAEPPATEQLEPHISRLEQLARKHSLIQ